MNNDKEITGLEILDELYGTSEPTSTPNTESTVVTISSDDFKNVQDQLDVFITIVIIIAFLVALVGGIALANAITSRE